MNAIHRYGLGLLAVGALWGSPGCGPAPGPAPAPENESALLAGLRAELAARDLELTSLREQQAGDEQLHRLRERVAVLEIELSREQQERLEREQEWLRFTRAIAALELASMPADLEFTPEVPGAPATPHAEPESDTESTSSDDPVAEQPADRRRERALEIRRSLVALLTIEEVYALTVLDVGALGEGWIGPVLFRISGAGGRLAGSLYAERLRLEGSRTGRTLTLVLEDGYEMRAGLRTPFARRSALEPGVRRIVLPYLDPLPWAESMPELFEGQTFDQVHDDGKWNLTLVRGTLNLLLREDAAAGWYRLKFLGGVTGDVLRDVHVLELDAAGNTRRHLFADRLKISIQEKGVLVLLEDGASIKGQAKTPFVAGELLLFFPRADHDDWIVEDLPLFDRGPAAGG